MLVGEDEEVYLVFMHDTSLCIYMKYYIDDDVDYELFQESEVGSHVRGMGHDTYNYGFIVCTEKELKYFMYDDVSLELISTYELEETLSSCYFDSADSYLLAGLEHGIREFELNGQEFEDRDIEYSPYKEVFDKEFAFLYVDSEIVLAISNDKEQHQHLIQYQREGDPTFDDKIVPNAYIPEGVL